MLVGALSDRPSVSAPSALGTLLTLPVPDDSLCAVPSFGAGVYPPADGALLSEGAEVVSGVAEVAGLEVVKGAVSPLSCVDAGEVAEIGATGADVS